MTDERSKRVRELFDAALSRPPEERESFLAEACGDDAALKAEVAELLAADDRAPAAFLQPPDRQAGHLAEDDADSMAGNQLGNYRIVRRIGHGGMGAVFEAEQGAPRRRVALKLIHSGAVSSHLMQRFEHEAQILATLHHSGIAQIYEAGTFETPAGVQPFFAMELVKGEILTEYARRHRLSTRQRLELAVRICDAVEHAHQKGVIHRDLKPTNILVDGSGQPKILDFGVARAIDSDITITTLRTDVGQLIGTIPYMSPEQAGGDPEELDTRSDIYALGVVLYELLSGRLPYDVGQKMIHEAVRVIREEDPVPLSSIDRALRGDIETIIGKALAKEKPRRYPSVSALAADIRHYLDDEPIAARRPSAMYQLRKLARRNRSLVGAAATVFVVLVAATIVSTVFYIRESQHRLLAESRSQEIQQARIEAEAARDAEAEARREAEREARIAQSVNAFLDEILSACDPWTDQSIADVARETKVVTVLDAASRTIENRFRGEPVVEAAIRNTLGRTYWGLGDYERAEPQLVRAFDLRRSVLGEKDLMTLHSMNNLGLLYEYWGRYEEAEPLYVRALEERGRVLGEENRDTLMSRSNLASLRHRQGRYEEAVALNLQTLEMRQRVLGDDDPDTLASMNNLAAVYRDLGRNDEAEPLYVETLRIRRQQPGGEEHPDTLTSMSNLATLYTDQGRHDEAEALYVEALDVSRRVLGAEHPRTLVCMNNLAVMLHGQARLDEAEPLFTDVLEISRKVLGPEHPRTLGTMNNLAFLYQRQARYDAAEPLLVRALEIFTRTLGEDHRDTIIIMTNLASCYMNQGRFDEALPVFVRAVGLFRKNMPTGHALTGIALHAYGRCLMAMERYEDAEAALLEAYEILKAARPAAAQAATGSLADLYDRWGKPEQAAEYRTPTTEPP